MPHVGKLDRVVGQVYEDLGQCAPIGTDHDVIGRNLQLEMQAPLLHQRSQRRRQFTRDIAA